MNELTDRIMETACQEGLLAEREPGAGFIQQLLAFMKKYGYTDGNGWWVKDEE